MGFRKFVGKAFKKGKKMVGKSMDLYKEHEQTIGLARSKVQGAADMVGGGDKLREMGSKMSGAKQTFDGHRDRMAKAKTMAEEMSGGNYGGAIKMAQDHSGDFRDRLGSSEARNRMKEEMMRRTRGMGRMPRRMGRR